MKRISPFKIVVIYMVTGGLWILFSDALLAVYIPDVATLEKAQTVKGWFFIAVTAGVLYLLTRRNIFEIMESKKRLQESERRLSTLMGNLPGIAYRCLNDRNWTMLFISSGCRRLTGYPAEDLLCSDKLSYNDLIHADDRSRIWDRVQDALREKESFQVRYRIKSEDGSEKWVWEQGVGVFSEKGDIEALEGFITDVTPLKQAEDELRRLNTELELRVEQRTERLKQTNQALQESMEHLKKTQEHLVQSRKMAALGELVAGVAHEINTPVGIGVTGASYLEMKTREASDLLNANRLTRSDLERYINTAIEASSSILSNLNRAAGLVKSFKQVAVDQASEKRRKFLIRDYIEKVLFSLAPRYKRTRHTVSVDCPEDLELFSYPGAFSQIITNLVLNSLVHGFEGIPEGKISLNVTVQDNSLFFRYEDNGKGIHPENVKKIFDPFFTTKRGRGGSGLGMAIIYNLVTQTLGGEISCESAEGRGTAFTMVLPLNGQADGGDT